MVRRRRQEVQKGNAVLSARYALWMDRVASRMAAFLIRRRTPLLLVFVVTTAVLGIHAYRIDLDPGFNKSIPNDHPYMEVYRKYAPQFGGGNVLTMALMSKDGDIFTPSFFRKLERLTDDVNAMPGIDQATTMSLFSPQAILIHVDETGFSGFRIVPADFKATDEYIAEVRERLLRSSEVGRLVSRDFTGALVFTEIIERANAPVDYQELGEKLETLRASYSDGATQLHIVGFAKFISDVMDGARAVILFFGIAFVITAVLLYFYTASAKLAFVSLAVALCSVVWELGLVSLLGYGIDPLSILVPFLVFSIGVSHAVQMANAWRIALREGNDERTAAEIAFEKVFIPGATALLTTTIGFGVVMVIDIPIIHELGVTASIGMAVMILTNKLLFPILLSFLKVDDKELRGIQSRADRLAHLRLWEGLAACTTPRASLAILGATMLVLLFGLQQREKLIVGDVGRGAPELRSTAPYNRDVALIQSKFNYNTDELIVMAQLPDSGCVDFRNMYWVDRFEGYASQQAGVSSVNSLAREIRVRYMGNSEGHPAFFEIPRSPYNISAGLARLELGQRLFDASCTVIPVRIFATDHNAETLAGVLEATKEFAEQSGGPVEFQLAAGSAGVMAATNEAVEAARWEMLVILYLVVATLCYVTFMSWRIALCVLIPLVCVSQLAEAVMASLGIGLKVSTLPVLALGAGVGVDYGIYLFSRTQSALREGQDLRQAYRVGLETAGSAVVFTAVTLTLGVATWMWSPLKFQADMGLLLAYMFFVNMIGAVCVLPALAAWLVKADSSDVGPKRPVGGALGDRRATGAGRVEPVA